MDIHDSRLHWNGVAHALEGIGFFLGPASLVTQGGQECEQGDRVKRAVDGNGAFVECHAHDYVVVHTHAKAPATPSLVCDAVSLAAQEGDMSGHAFMSYARKDCDFVVELAKFLTNADIPVKRISKRDR